MREISKYEFEQLLEEGCGYSHFTGGTHSENGKEIIDSHLGLFLFEENEVGGDLFTKHKEAQREDCDLYLQGLNSEYM